MKEPQPSISVDQPVNDHSDDLPLPATGTNVDQGPRQHCDYQDTSMESNGLLDISLKVPSNPSKGHMTASQNQTAEDDQSSLPSVVDQTSEDKPRSKLFKSSAIEDSAELSSARLSNERAEFSWQLTTPSSASADDIIDSLPPPPLVEDHDGQIFRLGNPNDIPTETKNRKWDHRLIRQRSQPSSLNTSYEECGHCQTLTPTGTLEIPMQAKRHSWAPPPPPPPLPDNLEMTCIRHGTPRYGHYPRNEHDSLPSYYNTTTPSLTWVHTGRQQCNSQSPNCFFLAPDSSDGRDGNHRIRLSLDYPRSCPNSPLCDSNTELNRRPASSSTLMGSSSASVTVSDTLLFF